MTSPTRLASHTDGLGHGHRSWRRAHVIGLTALTAYSTAIGWQAQLVSYPLFRHVAPADFLAYHAHYNAAIPAVVVVPGFLSFLACAAFPWTRPPQTSRRVAAVVGFAGVGASATTVAWAIPLHNRLDEIGQSLDTIDSLLLANLVRSLLLSLGTGALLYAASALSRGSTT